MTTDITPTLITNPPVVEGILRKRAEFSLLLPTVWAAAGHAIDFSTAANGSFRYITDWKFGGSAITGYGAKFNLIGTAGTGTHVGHLSASTCYVVAHHDSAGGGGSEAAEVLDAMPNSADPSTWDCNLEVWGY
jgi:hypothetical protein